MPPDSLYGRLEQIARNLWSTWNPEVHALFRELDPATWRQVNHNPVALLQRLEPTQVEERARETGLDSRIHFAYRRLTEYVSAGHTWAQLNAGPLLVKPVAYFVAEFGLHESLPLYGGGLGVLAGDTLKSASDLGVPLVGVGVLYLQSYFQQRLDAQGHQVEEYGNIDLSQLPLTRATALDGRPLTVSMEVDGSRLFAGVWLATVGRVKLVLLDCDVPENGPEDRALTSRLYGGDRRTRLRQEMVLGIGGLRTLRALGIDPGVIHLNEGHSAFALLERIRERMEGDGLSFEEAARETSLHSVFTTHTPVEAGHDRFEPNLVEQHLGLLRQRLGLSREEFLGLGRVNNQNPNESFCMTVLALKLSRYSNAVSCLHGHVSRRMWRKLWPGHTEGEIPIGHITNGVHIPTWVAPAMDRLLQRHLGRDWHQRAVQPEEMRGVESVGDTELWEVHQSLRHQLVDFARRRIVMQMARRGEPPDATERGLRYLSLDALTIGFARRFVTYKRATMILSDTERLAKLVGDSQRPVQFVFAGKAHPQDEAGKDLVRQVALLARDPRFEGRFVFIEDYDMNVTRHLIQGVDVWLNNPVRPLEACGTSGQKAALNGVLNLSVLDGWWAEACDGMNGFAIGNGDTHVSPEIQYERDASALFTVLEREVIPLFYDRDEDGLPLGWIARMKHAIETLGWRFNADRMVMDYVRTCYLPAAGGVSCAMRR